MRFARPLPLLALTLSLTACATAAPRGGTDAVAQLEAARSQAPRSPETNRALGIAYYNAGRYTEARATLETASRLDPQDGVTALYLGMTAEKQDDIPAARAAYTRYLEFGRTSSVRRQLEARLAALQRQQLMEAGRAAAARERELTGTTVSTGAVAVLTFDYSGPDSSMEPLGRGITELITTDLSRSGRLTVVERARLGALLDELNLGTTAGVESASMARSGRLLGAGRVIQGGITQSSTDALRVDASVVDVPQGRATGTATESDRLEQVFALQKRLVLQLFDELGVRLTAAERRLIDQRPTGSLMAFLAFSRGLMAEDAGRFDDASRFYDDAVRIDPGFRMAIQRSQQAAQVQAGAEVTPATVETSLQGTTEGTVAAAATEGVVVASPVSTTATTVNNINPSQTQNATSGTATTTSAPNRDPVSEGTGGDNPTSTPATVRIVVPIP
jgi:TolB-like protein